MKKTDLEKNKALKLMGNMKSAATPARFGGQPQVVDRREQRRLDQAAGLVPYATKLKQTTVEALRAKAAAEGISESELLENLLASALQ